MMSALYHAEPAGNRQQAQLRYITEGLIKEHAQRCGQGIWNPGGIGLDPWAS